jgi:hypothetical protein
MLTRQNGDMVMSQAIAYFTSDDYEICLPIGDKCNYDLIVGKNGQLHRAQIKKESFLFP